MNTYIYGDIILIENFIINYLIMWSSAKLLKIKYSRLKFFFASLIGSGYAVLSYIPELDYMFTMFMKILFSLLMIIIAFTPSNIKEFIKLTGVFYIITFIFGGAAFGLFYFIQGMKTTVNGVSHIERFPVKTLILSMIIAYIFVRYCWDYIMFKIKREKVFQELYVYMGKKKVKLMALLDTGNSLNEPITKSPVVVAEYDAIKELLPSEIQTVFEENSENNLNILSSILSSSDWATKFRVIPFKSLGRDNGMLIGFKPDELFLIDKKELICLKNVTIGIYNKKLSTSNEYSALMHPDAIEGETKVS